jgi:hypothetical protein
MTVRRACLPAITAAAAGLGSATALAAEWTVAPSASVYAQARQNPRLSADEEESDHITPGAGATASATITRRTELLALSLKPSVGATRYNDDGGLDTNDQRLEFSMNREGEKISWEASAGAVRDTTLTSELGSTGLTQANLRHESWNASVEPMWQATERLQLRSSVGLDSSSYPDNQNLGLTDYRYASASLSGAYSLSDRTAVSVSAGAGRLDSENSNQDSDNATLTVHARFAWSPLWSVSVAAGPSWTRSGDEKNNGVVYSFDLTRQLETSSLSLDATRRQSPSGRGVLTDVDSLGLGLSTQLTERLTSTVAASYNRRRNALKDFGGAGTVDLDDVRYLRADMGLNWRMTSSMQVGASVGYANQRVAQIFANDVTGRGYDARVSFIWTGQPYVH